MKHLKLKILFTNIRRIIMSILFINVGNFFNNKVKGIEKVEITCYDAGPTEPLITCYGLPAPEISIWNKIVDFLEENIFVLLVPIVLIIITIIFAAKKIKENRKIDEEVKRRMEEKNDKQD